MSDLELYERRTYDVHVGEMSKVLELYSSQGWPALEAGGHSRFLVGYFVSDTGPLHQLIHIWRFSGDVERRDFWKNFIRRRGLHGVCGSTAPLATQARNSTDAICSLGSKTLGAKKDRAAHKEFVRWHSFLAIRPVRSRGTKFSCTR